MRKKILVISQIPTHPQNAGNRIRLHNLCSLFKRACEVHFLYYDFEKYYEHVDKRADIKRMQSFFDYLYVVPNSHSSYLKDILYSVKILARKTMGKFIINFEESEKGKQILKLIKGLTKRSTCKLTGIDDWYDDNCNLDTALKNIADEINFDIVMAEYVFLSKALTYFKESTLKIIDTHDIFTDREKKLRGLNEEYEWFSVSMPEESKGLNRADIIFAIKDKDKDYFDKIVNKKVAVIGHPVTAIRPQPQKRYKNLILFAGSAASPNIHGIKWFIDKVFPDIKKKCPEVRILLAGGLSHVVFRKGCINLGEIPDIKKAYDMADIVINPVFFGTGLKIKSIEALGYGKALVTSGHGAEGLEAVRGKAYLAAESPEEFIQHIIKLYSDIDLLNQISLEAYRYAVRYNENIKRAFDDITGQ